MTDQIEQDHALLSYMGDDRVVPVEELKQIIASRPTPILYKSKFPNIDRYIEGFECGELTVLSGTPKGGKSLFLQTLTMKFHEQNVRTLWLSYELTNKQFIDRFPVLPPIIMPLSMKPHDLDWVRAKIQEGVVKYNTRAVMIDHMHYLIQMGGARNSSLDIGGVARALKRMAVELNVMIFLVWHTGKVEPGRAPTSYDIRDSSFAMQEPDTVLMIWRVDNNGEMENRVMVLASRRTGCMEKIVDFKKVNGWLEEKLINPITNYPYGLKPKPQKEVTDAELFGNR